MTGASGRRSRWIVGLLSTAAVALLPACGPGADVVEPGRALEAATEVRMDPCLDAKDLGELAWGETVLSDDNETGPRVDTGCSRGRAEYYRFTLGASSAVYADAFGSSIPIRGGVAPAPCGSAPPTCGVAACAEEQLQLLVVLPPGTWNLFVAGAEPRDQGEFLVHLHREPVSANLLGEIPPGASTLEGGFDSYSGGSWACGWAPYAWGYHLGCPEDPGGAVTIGACTACTALSIGYVDLEGASACEPIDDPDAACGMTGTLVAEDVAGAGLHLLQVGAEVMSTAGVTYTLEIVRP